MADIPTTRYVKSDDVHVAYQVIGEGPVDVPAWRSVAFDKTALLQATVKSAQPVCGCLRRPLIEIANHRHRLLCPRG